LQAFGKALGVPAEQLQSPKVADYGTFVMAVTNDWIYTGDVAGNQTFRPVSVFSHTAEALDKETTTDTAITLSAD
jgi:hypothetical protein